MQQLRRQPGDTTSRVHPSLLGDTLVFSRIFNVTSKQRPVVEGVKHSVDSSCQQSIMELQLLMGCSGLGAVWYASVASSK